MKVLDYIKEHLTYLDGGMGTLLQKRGLKPGEFPERWNAAHPEIIVELQKAYYDAGSNIVCTNTFGANCLKFEEKELSLLVQKAVENAALARDRSEGSQEKYIALDIGPMGKLLKPYGDFDFEDAVQVYAKTIKIGAACGVDLIMIETMNDSYDTKAALLAAKEYTTLPVFVSNAYGEDGKLMTGASPAAMTAMLEGMGADAIGANCSLGPAQMDGIVREYLKYASVPVLLKPNAGLPRSERGVTVYDVLPEEFSDTMADYVKQGIRIAGGCCGTTPEYIRQLVQKTEGQQPIPLTCKDHTMISSYTHTVEFGASPILIGERINPTGKKKLKEALRCRNLDYLLNEGLTQQEKGVQVLDVNVGLPELPEAEVLETVTCELQAVTDLPLQIDTSDPAAMERALRRYNGKAMVNSVNGKQESMDQIFPLVKKYGGLVVCLTLDEEGIPQNAAKRVEIAKKIIDTAASYGIEKKNLIFDPLAMTVSADANAASATLEALRRIRSELGCHTSLGVSNVSFGLPKRESITAVFFAMALENGLSAAIMNPYSADMMKTYYSFRALKGLDPNCADYIAQIVKFEEAAASPVQPSSEKKTESGERTQGCASALQRAIIKGLKEQAGNLTRELLASMEALEIVNRDIIPALDTVGQGFEKKTMYLPQLLMSAEAAQSAFEQIKAHLKTNASDSVSKGRVVIATVQGDIHDIGKNIVKLLLENYGFDVTDLGKDVAPERIVETTVRLHAPVVGLSALMTTTVPAMEETIRLLRKAAPWVKIAVGGAVLTQEYANQVGADFYGKDAMATVRYALGIVEK